MEKQLSFQDKLKLFQQQGNESSSNNSAIKIDKIKGIGKKAIISGEMINKPNNEIKKFIEEKPVFPCMLVSKEDNEKIELNIHCLKDINLDKIKVIKEERFEMVKRKDIYDYQLIDFSNFHFEISVLHNNINFSAKAKNLNSENNNSLIGKYKLYSFNINEGDLSFNSHFLKKFEDIANNNSSDQIKAKEIEEIFENQGYFIPLKIYIGGLFFNNIYKKNTFGLYKSFSFKIEEEKSLDFSKEEIKKIFLNENTKIIGGEKNEKNYEKWTESVKISNSNIIECTNIIEAKSILPNDLKDKLKKPLQLVEEKYLKRKKFFQIINSIKDIKLGENKGYNNFSKGICKESNIPEIYKKEIYAFGDLSFGFTEKTISEVFDDIIVGFEIVSKRNDDYNGEWDIKFNPLLKNKINIAFVTQFLRVEKYMINVYLMKIPE